MSRTYKKNEVDYYVKAALNAMMRAMESFIENETVIVLEGKELPDAEIKLKPSRKKLQHYIDEELGKRGIEMYQMEECNPSNELTPEK